MSGDDDILVQTAQHLVEIAKRILELAREVSREDITPGEVSARAFAEAECLRKISDELKC